MDIRTSRFGTLEIGPDDVFQFPFGLVGWEDCREWILLADSRNDAVAWLQNTERPDLALAVVSPRRFVANYQVRLASSDLAPLHLNQVTDAHVLAVLGKTDSAITINLKAPLVINLDKGLGRQVIAKNAYPVRHRLSEPLIPMRKTA